MTVPLPPAGIAPLRIGRLAPVAPVVLAPMAGVTDASFRQLCRESGPGLVYVNEMVTARGVVERNDKSLKMVRSGGGERPRSVQLYGTAPATLGEAVRYLVGDVGVDHVDLNFGCPVPKVTRKGGGAALPVRRRLLADIVAAAVRAAAPAGVPVTLKCRIGVHDGLQTFLDTGRAAEENGAAAIALHARTAEQRYAPTARWSAIAELKAAVTSIPVLGNGDIWEAADALTMMAETGCDGVVVGRGCLGRPWLFAELLAAFAGRPVPPPPRLGRVAATMARHAELLCREHGAVNGIRCFRKHVGWYLAGYPVGPALRRNLAQAVSLADAVARLADVDPDVELPEGGRRLVRGHRDGPRAVSLPHGWLDLVDDPTPPEGAELLVSGG